MAVESAALLIRFKPLVSAMQVESKMNEVKEGFERHFDGFS
jgi:hypothetical protein